MDIYNGGASFPRAYPPHQNLPAGHVSFRLLCHASRIGGVIGKSGSVIKHLQHETSARIRVDESPAAPNSGDRVIIITASSSITRKVVFSDEEIEVSAAQEAVVRVFEKILDVAAESDGRIIEELGLVSCRLLAEQSHAGSVIGKGGKVVEKIRKDTGSKIRVLSSEKLPACASPNDEMIEIEGEFIAVKKALIAVSRRLQDSPPVGRAHEVDQQESLADGRMDIPPVRSSVPQPNSGSSFNHAPGRPFSSDADHHPNTNLRMPQQEVTFRILCSHERVGVIIGKQGMVVRALQNESGASINVASPLPDCKERLVTITATENAESRYSAAQNAVILVFNKSIDAGYSKGIDSVGKRSPVAVQIPGLRHAILVGDERQLPALVKSKVSDEAGFGRSLFTRLVSLGYKKDRLDIQYRMHPSISLFPNKEFYNKQIADGPNVRQKNYQKHILEGDMYGSYSFINIAFGMEESSDGYSMRNIMEVAIIAEVVASLCKASTASKQKLSVGVISPYNAQVFAIQENFGTRYSTDSKSDFSVTVRSVDGFQGGEEDVIIISTVRCNGNGSVGFLSNRQRANVALTRARYCLWIFGNEATLRSSRSVWRNLITDAKNRGCYYNAQEDKRLAKAIIATLVDIDPFEISLSIDSLLFQEARWKVCFSKNFWTSMSIIQNIEIRKEALSLLTKLSSGLRWPCNDKSLLVIDGKPAQLVELCKVNCMNYIVWSIDIVKEQSSYSQVLKVWDMLPPSKIPNIVKDLDYLFGSYNMDLVHLCKLKKLEGTLEVPITWRAQSDGVRKTNLPGTDPMQHLCSRFAAMSLKDN